MKLNNPKLHNGNTFSFVLNLEPELLSPLFAHREDIKDWTEVLDADGVYVDYINSVPVMISRDTQLTPGYQYAFIFQSDATLQQITSVIAHLQAINPIWSQYILKTNNDRTLQLPAGHPRRGKLEMYMQKRIQ